jgi:hypothetical protein
MWEVEVGGSQSKVDLVKSERPYLKNKLQQKGLGVCGLSGRPLVQQVEGPEFKPQYYKKKNEADLHSSLLSLRKDINIGGSTSSLGGG